VASAGNIIFVAGKRRLSSPTARFMFHEPSITADSGVAMSEKDLLETAAQLRSNGDRNRGILEAQTKMSAKQIDALKSGTKTVTPDEAVELGLATQIKELKIPAGATLDTINS
jgi:ATP-dependent protease ClpP protease subunit